MGNGSFFGVKAEWFCLLGGLINTAPPPHHRPRRRRFPLFTALLMVVAAAVDWSADPLRPPPYDGSDPGRLSPVPHEVICSLPRSLALALIGCRRAFCYGL